MSSHRRPVDGHRVQAAEREGLRGVPGERQRHRRTSCPAIVPVPGVGSGRVVADWRPRMRMAHLLAATSNSNNIRIILRRRFIPN